MKHLISVLALALFAIGLQSCNSDNDPEGDGNHRLDQDEKAEVYKFKLALGGDYVEESETPLTRADNASYVGINVKRTEKGKSTKEKYAYGVFSKKSGIEIELVSGYTYDFEASVITDNTDLLYSDSYGFPEPFVIWEEEVTDPNFIKNVYPQNCLNSFQYTFDATKFPKENSKNSLCDLKYGRAKVKLAGDRYKVFNCNYPRVDRFYGTKNGIDPLTLPESGEINIDVDYKCFGIEIDASSIPKGTKLSWQDVTKGRNNDGASYQLLQFPDEKSLTPDNEESSKWSDVYSLYNLTGDGNESFTFKFIWNKGGKEETFEQTFQVRAKYKKTLKIIISGDANINSKGNIIINETGKGLTPDDPLIIQPQND